MCDKIIVDGVQFHNYDKNITEITPPSLDCHQTKDVDLLQRRQKFAILSAIHMSLKYLLYPKSRGDYKRLDSLGFAQIFQVYFMGIGTTHRRGSTTQENPQ